MVVGVVAGVFRIELSSGMDKRTLIAILVAVLTPIFVALIVVFFATRKPSEPHYFKRVAKKYSIPPLDLR